MTDRRAGKLPMPEESDSISLPARDSSVRPVRVSTSGGRDASDLFDRSSRLLASAWAGCVCVCVWEREIEREREREW